jgi:cyclophilin family peptidyl-prolyl cis-trans isomerase
MKNFKPVFLLFAVLVFFQVSCQDSKNLVLISTEYGDIKVKLYEETPLHKENFLKLVGEGFYDSLLFHRVINEFMIQGGDPDSKGAAPGVQLGNGGPGYQIDAEIIDGLYHKKGVLAAARQGDQMNPEKKSSGSQFYIVQGKVFTNEELDMLEERMNMQVKQQVVMDFISKPENAALKQRADSLYMNRMQEELQALLVEIDSLTKDEYEASDLFVFSVEQREAYTTVGGTPHLDGAYSVFGEVVEGLDVIDKIAAVEADQAARPVKDLKMTMKIVKK